MGFTSKIIYKGLFFFCIILSNTSIAQINYSDSIKSLSNKLRLANTFQARKYLSENIKKCISEGSSNNTISKLDSLDYISFYSSTNGKLKLFSWELSNDSGSYIYECVVIIKTKNCYKAVFLTDKGDELKNPEYAASNSNKWYGAHYYQMVEKTFNRKIYYTLIGINWKSILSKKKVIETISIDANNNLIFGEPIFQIGNKLQRRFILEYKYDISINCRYNKETKLIVFDHLVPPNPALKFQKQFYVNDLSFDAFKFLKGKWIYYEDIDARNSKSKEDDTYSAPK